MKILMALVLAANTLTASTDAAAGAHRVMLGAVGQNRQEVEEREQELGHRLPGVRVFRRWDQQLFTADEQWARNTGHTIFLSIKSKLANGDAVSWHDIATASSGSALEADMRRQADEIRRFGALVYLVFNHEPDANASASMGDPADFVAAWRRLVKTYRAVGVRNARYVWTLTGYSFGRQTSDGTDIADSYYPGDAYVDDIGADTYNWYDCRGNGGTWQSLAELVEPQRLFGLKHPDKGLMLLEFGSAEDPDQPGRKAQWLRDAAEVFADPAYQQFRAALHWDDRHTGLMDGTACDFDYRSSPEALDAWRSLPESAVFGAASPCDLGDCGFWPRPIQHYSARPATTAAVTGVLAGEIGYRAHRL